MQKERSDRLPLSAGKQASGTSRRSDEEQPSGVDGGARLLLYECSRLNGRTRGEVARVTLRGTRERTRKGARRRVRSQVLSEFEYGGAGGGRRGLEQAGEWAGGDAGPDVACVWRASSKRWV